MPLKIWALSSERLTSPPAIVIPSQYTLSSFITSHNALTRDYSLSGNVGVMLLCEVAAQPFYEKYDAEYDASENCLKAGKRLVSCVLSVLSVAEVEVFTTRATKGIGRTQPKRWKDAGDALDHPELKGCHMPDGPCGQDDATGGKGYLQYNEVRGVSLHWSTHVSDASHPKVYRV